MEVRLTTLCDNLVASMGFSGEWGLSILVECGPEAILLDTGMTDCVVRNAIRSGIDLQRITRIVISHGHKDHTGGLRALFQTLGQERDVIMHPEAWAPKYSVRPESTGDRMHFIGIPHTQDELEYLGARFKLSRKPVWINDRIVVTGEVPLKTPFEAIDKNLFVKTGGDYKPDGLLDDQALVVKTAQGLIVILGCAHHGMINTLLHAREITGEKKIHAVVGGTHLLHAGSDQITRSIASLEEFEVAHIGVSHCTGMPASMALWQHFEDRFFFNHVGKVMAF